MAWMRAEDASRTRPTAPAGCRRVRAPGVAALAQCLQPPESRCMHDLKSVSHGHGKSNLSAAGSDSNARYSNASTAPTLSPAPFPAILVPMLRGANDGGALRPSLLAAALSAGVPSPSRM
eukprot:5791300-Pleurochrysis_carterae.AAC.1